MNHTGHPLRINVGFLVNQSPGFQREIPFEFDHFEFDNDLSIEDLKVIITLARTQNGVRSVVEASATTELECGRCLDPFMQELHTEFEEIFTFYNHPLSEDEAIIPEDGNIDFEPILREYLLLEIPYTPICRPDCQGLCYICGQNLNDAICAHMQKANEEDKGPTSIRISYKES